MSRGGVEAEAINTLAKLKSEYPKQYASAIKETLAGAARSRNPIKNPLGFLVKHLSQKKAQKQSRYGENDPFATAPNSSETNSIAIAEHRAKVSVGDDQTEDARTCAESVPLPELPEDDPNAAMSELYNQFVAQADELADLLAQRRTTIRLSLSWRCYAIEAMRWCERTSKSLSYIPSRDGPLIGKAPEPLLEAAPVCKALAKPIENRMNQTLETDEVYPHGRLALKSLGGVNGYSLALQYDNPTSLGKALRALGGTIYWLPPENDRIAIWLSDDEVRKLPGSFTDRVAYLSQFEVQEKGSLCDKCKKVEVVYASGKYGHPVRLLCLSCSPFVSATSDKALAAAEQASQLRNVLLQFRPIRKVQVEKLKKAA